MRESKGEAMCLAQVYVVQDDEDKPTAGEPTLRDVAWIEIRDDGLMVRDLLGNKHVVRASIRSIDFLEGSVILREAGG